MSRIVLLGAMAAGLAGAIAAAVIRGNGTRRPTGDSISPRFADGEFVVARGFSPEQQDALSRLHECCWAPPAQRELAARRTEVAALRRDQHEATEVAREGFLGTLNAAPPLRRAGSVRPA